MFGESLLSRNIWGIPAYIKKIIVSEESSRALEFLPSALARAPALPAAKSHSWKAFAHFFQNTSHLGSGQPWKVSSKCNIWEGDDVRLGLPSLDRGHRRCRLTPSPDGRADASLDQPSSGGPDAPCGPPGRLPAPRLARWSPPRVQSPRVREPTRFVNAETPGSPGPPRAQPRGGNARGRDRAGAPPPGLPRLARQSGSPPQPPTPPALPPPPRLSAHPAPREIWLLQSPIRREVEGTSQSERGEGEGRQCPPAPTRVSAECLRPSPAPQPQCGALGRVRRSSSPQPRRSRRSCESRNRNHTHVAGPVLCRPLGVPPEAAFRRTAAAHSPSILPPSGCWQSRRHDAPAGLGDAARPAPAASRRLLRGSEAGAAPRHTVPASPRRGTGDRRPSGRRASLPVVGRGRPAGGAPRAGTV